MHQAGVGRVEPTSRGWRSLLFAVGLRAVAFDACVSAAVVWPWSTSCVCWRGQGQRRRVRSCCCSRCCWHSVAMKRSSFSGGGAAAIRGTHLK
ncbi:hypothetical protein PF005_g1916 [Phytophthora fragariae]|uniref:Uncharacterized protein n=1 Tax=Phytophthora fragariae TaxID=53985 RepID=A0A6A4AEU5_9STRA|nr:hypothetical protein PF003_g27241 [Phytophthora fragariae]KAE8948426.1 hypothetical protein PF009_g2006 [Phytophthora fragariae]KAE9027720.1 hypothetical protein PF011_g1905 [Phytophthora fragariae]KAE9136854.1 hypothetical protein PF007_g2033 [Phytophthora fragariae]KAE9234388.1 hypothetical protein PF005_g1916 [Phytophthora fragariae]